MEKALEAKAKGNEAFAAKRFREAIEHFSEAIGHQEEPVFYSNRWRFSSIFSVFQPFFGDV